MSKIIKERIGFNKLFGLSSDAMQRQNPHFAVRFERRENGDAAEELIEWQSWVNRNLNRADHEPDIQVPEPQPEPEVSHSARPDEPKKSKTQLTWLNIPLEVWRDVICDQFINLNDRSLLRPTNSFFEKLWQDVILMRKINVPRGCADILGALELASTMCKRLKKPGTPFKIELEEGEHYIPPRINTTIKCNDIVFVGEGPTKTTIQGGFRISGKTGIGFYNLSITNRWGSGLTLNGMYRTPKTRVVASNCRFYRCYSSGVKVIGHQAKLRAVKCEILQTRGDGLVCRNAAKVRLTNCTFHNNADVGIDAMHCNTHVHIRGENTSIHQNKSHGIHVINFATVRIFLPSSHPTVSKNGSKDIESTSSFSFYGDGEVVYV